jgi:UDP-N-acetylglucosamine:LPS N-acetylglucosamine transferase
LSFRTLKTQVNLAELDPEQLAQAVLDALSQPSRLEAVATAARERALGYDEAACGQKLLLALQGTAAV